MQYWTGPAPQACDLCKRPITSVFTDGRVASIGSWAFMCPQCHRHEGLGLGSGRGQQYRKGHGGQWFKAVG